MDLPFYKLALVRNLITRIIEENPKIEELKSWNISSDVREDLCSLSEEELIDLINDTQYITNRNLSKEEILEIKNKLSILCR
ncbi:hypothetical protein DFR86_00530 [Acidianus sulfidivorans JP7]|uniref:Uncharacterized protein n=1 Tax=Acidianus sulfidivorans JP7 TaxID=619593 RepID=A0A2U9IJI8_9CREN|nr:hypothetical protein [Acidianus sulfidivorans]AWR96180.1 hypothetical protein DFR86_00530 [Acidianus sulfidivorans JP7]